MTERQNIDGYRDLADLLAYEIESGMYGPGSRLPGEIEMSRKFSLNRHTVGAALNDLVQRDYVYRIQGKGTYVSHRKVPYSISPHTRFSATISSLGLKPGASVIAIECIPANNILAKNLGVEFGHELTELNILRTIESVPVAYSKVYLSADRFPDLKSNISEFHSLYAVLETHYHVTGIKRASSHIEAELPNVDDQKHLHVSSYSPILVVSSQAKDRQGIPVEYCISRCRGDLYKLHVNLAEMDGQEK